MPILMLAVLMLYNPPESVTALYLFGWLALLYFGWDAWSISHTSWALELSRDYDRRSRITGLLQVLVMIGGILISLVPAILERVAAPTYPELASAIGWFMIVVLPLTAIICLVSVPEPRRPIARIRDSAAARRSFSPTWRCCVCSPSMRC